jgi:hypothetical protein
MCICEKIHEYFMNTYIYKDAQEADKATDVLMNGITVDILSAFTQYFTEVLFHAVPPSLSYYPAQVYTYIHIYIYIYIYICMYSIYMYIYELFVHVYSYIFVLSFIDF